MIGRITKECDFCGYITDRCEQYVKCPQCKKGIMWKQEDIEDMESEEE